MLMDFNALAQECSPSVHPVTMQAVVRTESSFNPYAIGVVGGRLARQPRNQAEAVATANRLSVLGWNYSMGLAQVNRANLARYGLTTVDAFDPCSNLRAGGAILSDCYARAVRASGAGRQSLQKALSCYYSGNFTTGFVPDSRGRSYVQRVVAAGSDASRANVVPPIEVIRDVPGARQEHRREGAALPGPGTASDAASAGPAKAAWDAFGAFRSK